MSDHVQSTAYRSSQPTSEDHPRPVNTLRRAGALQRRVEAALKAWDLTWAKFDTLLGLREKGPMRVREAIDELGEGFPRRLESRYRDGGGLVEMGYVEKTSDPSHAQAKLVVLTEKGEEVLSQALLALENLSATREEAEIREAA